MKAQTLLLCSLFLLIGNTQGEEPSTSTVEGKAQKISEHLNKLDETLWDKEVQAQKHEAVFTALWDSLRSSSTKLETLLQFAQFPVMMPGEVKKQTPLAHEIDHFHTKTSKETQFDTFDQAKLAAKVQELKKDGIELIQSEWHHDYFYPATDKTQARSTVSAELHLKSDKSHYQIKMHLGIVWKKGKQIEIEKITVEKFDLWSRAGMPAFVPVVRYDAPKDLPNNIPVTPLIVSDINEDGLIDIALPAINEVLWNQGNFKFQRSALLGDAWQQFRAAVYADFTGDGIPDLLGQTNAGPSILFTGEGNGKFSNTPSTPWKENLTAVRALTSGDIDGDGDLDVWAAQYKASYLQGQMPTPFYDANDGFPSFLFINDGKGNFIDETEKRFKDLKRNRRTFSSSFVDFNEDSHLDLLVVSDFSGVDIYLNDGKGHFHDATGEFIKERNVFGMSHSFGNFDGDDKADFYVAGMSSTTARRLKQLGLERDEFPEHTKMREAMTYGNRLYQRKGATYTQTDLNTKAARAGWAWGCSALDFNNDGFDDIYVTNGNQSGKTSKDYCSRYWCHDIYTGDSKERPEIKLVLSDTFRPKFFQGLYKGQVSWNGFEHNRLFMNEQGKSFSEIGYLMGVGLEDDSRCVAAADFNNDGQQDLAVLFLKRKIDAQSMSWRHSVTVFGNTLRAKGNWITVRLRGVAGVSPIGAKVMIEGKFGSREMPIVNGDCLDAQLPALAHFGLGESDEVEKVTVLWPNRTRTELKNPDTRKIYTFEPGN